MILVTSAAGKTGRAVIAALLIRSEAVRALVHRPEQIEPLRELGAAEVVVGDMSVEGTLTTAMSGVRGAYHIAPPVHPHEEAIGHSAVEAAVAAGVEHIAYHSVLHPMIENMPHHWAKLRVEQHLVASGLSYTVLQPAMYMQNVLGNWKGITGEGVYPVPYRTDTRFSLADVRDVGEVAAMVLTQPGHAGATYELCGAEVLTPGQMAEIMGRQLGRAVRAESIPVEVWEERARAAGLGEHQAATLATMFRYYNEHGLRGNQNVLGWLLGRRPTNFEEFVASVVKG